MHQLAPEKKLRLVQQPKTTQSEIRGVDLKRRMLDLLPDERFAVKGIFVSSGATALQQLTGCLKVEAPKFMSRSGILIVRGKVVACIYGSKSVPGQLLGKKAFEKV